MCVYIYIYIYIRVYIYIYIYLYIYIYIYMFKQYVSVCLDMGFETLDSNRCELTSIRA